VTASTPSGFPATEPLLVTVIAPPLLRTGPGVEAEMVCSDGTQAACAASIELNDASAINEAEASSAARKQPILAGVNGFAGSGSWCPLVG
jgi:hypothetical protein